MDVLYRMNIDAEALRKAWSRRLNAPRIEFWLEDSQSDNTPTGIIRLSEDHPALSQIMDDRTIMSMIDSDGEIIALSMDISKDIHLDYDCYNMSNQRIKNIEVMCPRLPNVIIHEIEEKIANREHPLFTDYINIEHCGDWKMRIMGVEDISERTIFILDPT